jgi:transposase
MPYESVVEEAAAIRSQLGAIFVSLELSRKTWLVTSLSPGLGERMSRHSVAGGQAGALLVLLRRLQSQCQARTGRLYGIVTIQEAGLDGFWLHRVLASEGIESHVVDAASIAICRRRRRVKTDRIDGEGLLRTLMAYKRGEPRVCSMVRPPSPREEDERRPGRERAVLLAERIKHVNRIKGLLFAQGIGGYEPLRKGRRRALDALRTGDGRALPVHLKAQIGRELDRLEQLLEQISAVEQERDKLLAPEPSSPEWAGGEPGCAERAHAPQTAVPSPACLRALRGIGPDFAGVLWQEGLSRHFANRRQVAAYAGLAPTPWRSGSLIHEQGVSKAGNPRLRTTLIQLAWLWLRHQPQSGLTKWFNERAKPTRSKSGKIVPATKAARKTAIVALARKLLIALWKYLHDGVLIEGAVMKHPA